MDKRLDEILRHLHPAPGFKLWHGGATVLGALRGVSPHVAAWRPYPDRHSIWGLALHIAYWNYAVERRITDSDIGGFPRSPANFPRVPEPPSQSAWDADRKLVKVCHESLVAVLSDFDQARLDRVAGGTSKTTYADLITGILMHDTYHAGQIQMMKRLARSHGL